MDFVVFEINQCQRITVSSKLVDLAGTASEECQDVLHTVTVTLLGRNATVNVGEIHGIHANKFCKSVKFPCMHQIKP